MLSVEISILFLKNGTEITNALCGKKMWNFLLLNLVLNRITTAICKVKIYYSGERRIDVLIFYFRMSVRFFRLRILRVVFAVPWIGYRPVAG